MTREDLAIYQGDDYAAIVTVVAPDGSPADLTGFAAKAQLRRKAADLAPVEIEFAVEVESPDIRLSLTHEETAELSGMYCWDLELTEVATGVVTTILHGQVKVTLEVTRLTAMTTGSPVGSRA